MKKQEAKDHSVIDCQIWGTGLVALTGNFKLVALTNFEEPRPRLMADPGKFALYLIYNWH